jgi:hypothetical protein
MRNSNESQRFVRSAALTLVLTLVAIFVPSEKATAQLRRSRTDLLYSVDSYITIGRYDQATSSLTVLRRQDRSGWEPLYREAVVLFMQGRTEESIGAFTALRELSLSPGSASAAPHVLTSRHQENLAELDFLWGDGLPINDWTGAPSQWREGLVIQRILDWCAPVPIPPNSSEAVIQANMVWMPANYNQARWAALFQLYAFAVSDDQVDLFLETFNAAHPSTTSDVTLLEEALWFRLYVGQPVDEYLDALLVKGDPQWDYAAVVLAATIGPEVLDPAYAAEAEDDVAAAESLEAFRADIFARHQKIASVRPDWIASYPVEVLITFGILQNGVEPDSGYHSQWQEIWEMGARTPLLWEKLSAAWAVLRGPAESLELVQRGFDANMRFSKPERIVRHCWTYFIIGTALGDAELPEIPDELLTQSLDLQFFRAEPLASDRSTRSTTEELAVFLRAILTQNYNAGLVNMHRGSPYISAESAGLIDTLIDLSGGDVAPMVAYLDAESQRRTGEERLTAIAAAAQIIAYKELSTLFQNGRLSGSLVETDHRFRLLLAAEGAMRSHTLTLVAYIRSLHGQTELASQILMQIDARDEMIRRLRDGVVATWLQ